MPITKLSMKVLDELNVDNYSPTANKIEMAISSRGSYLKELKQHEYIYSKSLSKLLMVAQVTKPKQFVNAVNCLIDSHKKLRAILEKYIDDSNQFKQLDEIYCFKEVSQWFLSSSKGYLLYSQLYTFDHNVSDYSAQLMKMPFIRYKALVKLVNKLYQLSLHFENSLPDFKFTDITLCQMFVEITHNLRRAAKFSSIQWNVIKDFLNNEKLYVDYFSISFNSACDIITLVRANPNSCKFNPNRILKRDYFQFEFIHPAQKSQGKQIIELMLLSESEVMDYDSIHKSHTARSLEKLAKIESKEDLLAEAADDTVDKALETLVNNEGCDDSEDNDEEFGKENSMGHSRDLSTLSMVNSDAVEDSYKGCSDFKFSEISQLAICSIDATIGRSLLFPPLSKERGQVSIKTINKLMNEVVLVAQEPKSKKLITLKISSLEDRQFNNWIPFLRVLFNFYNSGNEASFFAQHQVEKKKIGFFGALGININAESTNSDNYAADAPNSPVADDNVDDAIENRGSTSSDDFAPLRFTKKSTTESQADTQEEVSEICEEPYPPTSKVTQIGAFIEHLESRQQNGSQTAHTESFDFNEISHSEKSTPNQDLSVISETRNFNTTMASSVSTSSTTSKTQRINNMDKVLSAQRVSMYDDNESDWTSITTSSNVSSPTSDIPSSVDRYLCESKGSSRKKHSRVSTSSVSIKEFKYHRFDDIPASRTNKVSNVKVNDSIIEETSESPVNSPVITDNKFVIKKPDSSLAPASSATKTPAPKSPAALSNLPPNPPTIPRPTPFSAFTTPSMVSLDAKSGSTATLELPKSQKQERSPALSLTFSEVTTELKKEFLSAREAEEKTTPAKISFFRKKSSGTPIFKKLFARSNTKKRNDNEKPTFVFDNEAVKSIMGDSYITTTTAAATQSTTAQSSTGVSNVSRAPTTRKARRTSVILKKKIIEEEKPVISSTSSAVTAIKASVPIASHGPKPIVSGTSKVTSKATITKSSSSKSLNSAKRLSIGQGAKKRTNGTAFNQQKMLQELSLGKLKIEGSSTSSLGSAKYSNILIPNNYSVSSLEDVSKSSPVTPIKNAFMIKPSSPLKNTTFKPASPLRSASTMKSASPAKSLKSQSTSYTSGFDEFGSSSSFASPSKLSFAINNQSPSKSSCLTHSSVSNSSFVTGLTHQQSVDTRLNFIEQTKSSKTSLAADISHQRAISDDEDIPVPKEEYHKNKMDCSSTESDNKKQPVIEAVDLSNFGKSIEPHFYDEAKKPRKSKLLSLKRKKSDDFQIVNKTSIRSPAMVNSPRSPYSIIGTPKSFLNDKEVVHSPKKESKSKLPNNQFNSSNETIVNAKSNPVPQFSSLKKIGSPSLGSLIKKEKNLKGLSIKTTGNPKSSSVASPMTPDKISSSNSFASISDQYFANIENCVILLKDYFQVSHWKNGHWQEISNELLYLEIAISVEQSYLCFYKSSSLKSSLVSIKPFIILPIDSNSVVTKNNEDEPKNFETVQIKTYNRYNHKTNFVSLSSRNYDSSLNLIHALSHAQKDHTSNSLIKTRLKLSKESSISMFQELDESSMSSLSEYSNSPYKNTAGQYASEAPNPVASPTKQISHYMEKLKIEPMSERKIRLHKKSSISGKWTPIAISRLQIFAVNNDKSMFDVEISDFKTGKSLVESTINGMRSHRIGRTGVCIMASSKDGVVSKHNYLIESRNELEADELFGILTSGDQI